MPFASAALNRYATPFLLSNILLSTNISFATREPTVHR